MGNAIVSTDIDRAAIIGEHSPGIIYQKIRSPDGSLRYTYISAAVRRIYGLEPEAVIQDAQVFLDRNHPDDRERIFESYQTVAADLTDWTLEFRIVDTRGDVKWMHGTSSPYRNDAGETVWNGLLIDITERKRLEDKVRESDVQAARAHARLIDAIECMPALFHLYDSEDRLVLANSRCLEAFPDMRGFFKPGVSYEEILRFNIARGLDAKAIGREEAYVAERLARFRDAKEGFDQPLSDGRWYHVIDQPTSDGGTVGMRIDITKQKRAESELRDALDKAKAADLAKSTFLANVSHELRTPLSSILGFAELISRSLADVPERETERHHAEYIRDSGNHLLSLINEILDAAKIESGVLQLREEPVEIALVSEAVRHMLSAQAENAGITLTVDVAPLFPKLWADPTRIRQILINLLSNAINFTPQGGTVTLRAATCADGGTALIVADTGVGMGADDIATALTAFAKIDDGHTRCTEGTGLGLPLAKTLAELHGGSLGLQSTPGVGTTVTVTFPASRTRARPNQVVSI